MTHLEDMEMEEKAEPLRRVAWIPARIHASPKVAYPNRDTSETRVQLFFQAWISCQR